jgi:hypothetical protein
MARTKVQSSAIKKKTKEEEDEIENIDHPLLHVVVNHLVNQFKIDQKEAIESCNTMIKSLYQEVQAHRYAHGDGYVTLSLHGPRRKGYVLEGWRFASTTERALLESYLLEHFNCILDDDTLKESKKSHLDPVIGQRPKSKYRGVHWSYGGWIAQISKNRKTVYLGKFSNEEDAYKRYLDAGGDDLPRRTRRVG